MIQLFLLFDVEIISELSKECKLKKSQNRTWHLLSAGYQSAFIFYFDSKIYPRYNMWSTMLKNINRCHKKKRLNCVAYKSTQRSD